MLWTPRHASLLALLLLALAWPAPVRGAEPEQDATAAFDARVAHALARKHPELSYLWALATDAYRADNCLLAEELYYRVTEVAPEFHHAYRRRCACLTQMGNRDRALWACRRALGLKRTPENLATMALALVAPDPAREADAALMREVTQDAGGGPPLDIPPVSPEDVRQALRLAREAADVEPGLSDVFVQKALGSVALEAEDGPGLVDAGTRLSKLLPQDWLGYYLLALGRALRGSWDGAHAALGDADARGLDAAEAARLRGLFEQAASDEAARPENLLLAFLEILFVAVLAWLGGFVLLRLLGGWFSRRALAAVRTLGPDPRRIPPAVSRIGRGYRLLLHAAGLYYYVSIPFVALSTLVAAGGMIALFYAIGYIPIKLAALVGFGALVTLVALLSGLARRPDGADPGLRLELAEHSKLRAVLHEVADRVGTAPVDTVFLTPVTDIAVFEKGSMGDALRGRATERNLLLGVGALQGMSLCHFKSILTHEYGHFVGGDTMGGRFALAARAALTRAAVEMAENGAATWYNPGWWFMKAYWRTFERISLGASRLKEILADRWEAALNGAETFVAATIELIERDVRFHWRLGAAAAEIAERELAVRNLYRYEPEAEPPEEELEEAIAKILDAPTTEDDSHPSPRDRFAFVRGLGLPEVECAEEGTAWELLEGREELEVLMTERLRLSGVMGIRWAAPEEVEAKATEAEPAASMEMEPAEDAEAEPAEPPASPDTEPTSSPGARTGVSDAATPG